MEIKEIKKTNFIFYKFSASLLQLIMEKNKKYFIRTSGKGDFKIYQLISLENFEILNMFFQTNDDAIFYAKSNLLEIVDYKEIEELA